MYRRGLILFVLCSIWVTGAAQVWDDFQSPYRDTSFKYELEEGRWELTRRTIDFRDNYDQIMMREQQEKDSTGRWKAFQRDRYESPEPGKTVIETIERKNGEWQRIRRSAYEYFPNSNEHRTRNRQLWDKEKEDWRLDYEYERIYEPGSRVREDITRYFNKEGRVRHAQREVIQMGMFGGEEVKESYRKSLGDSLWRPISKSELLQMGDSTHRERRRWDEERGTWGDPIERTVKIYYRPDEFLPQPVMMNGKGRYLKERRNDRFDEELQEWLPDEKELIEYEERDSGHIRRNTQFEWNPVENTWRGISRTTYEYDGQGHSRGYLREQYDPDKDSWTPDTRSKQRPGKDGYLHSIQEKWNEEKGGWNSTGKRRYQPCYPVTEPDRT